MRNNRLFSSGSQSGRVELRAADAIDLLPIDAPDPICYLQFHKGPSMPAFRPLLIAALLCAFGGALPPQRSAYAAGVVGFGTPASCTEAELAARLAGGG